jgi:hypothetical protein
MGEGKTGGTLRTSGSSMKTNRWSRVRKFSPLSRLSRFPRLPFRDHFRIADQLRTTPFVDTSASVGSNPTGDADN